MSYNCRCFWFWQNITHNRGVSQLEEVLPMNAHEEALEDFIDQYHISLVHPTMNQD